MAGLRRHQRQVRSLTLRIDSVTVRGPMDEKYWVRPKNFEKFFTGDAPKGAGERREYARKILEPFVRKAYRQPVDSKTIDRLATVRRQADRPPSARAKQQIRPTR